MIYVSAYNSPTLDENSSHRYKEGAITHITITENDDDISNELNKHIHIGLDLNCHPNWDELALCLRTDWKRLVCLPVKEGAILTTPLRKAFEKSFDRPEICQAISALLETYAQYFGQDGTRICHLGSPPKDMYCLNKHESFTLEWGFSIVDQGNDDKGLQNFREALIVGKIKDEIENVQWAFYH